MQVLSVTFLPTLPTPTVELPKLLILCLKQCGFRTKYTTKDLLFKILSRLLPCPTIILSIEVMEEL